MLKQTME